MACQVGKDRTCGDDKHNNSFSFYAVDHRRFNNRAQKNFCVADYIPSFIYTWLTHSCFFCIPLVEKLSIGMSWEVER